mmetsp:Transcript_11819/g.31902  ORF Transcript_11819/g.31902 Transcript_11819/m.31902 type:complete len:270 (-) Transcript_11819:93-902(-)
MGETSGLVVCAVQQFCAAELWLRLFFRGRRTRLEPRELLARKLDKFCVIHGARGRNHHPIRRVIRLDVLPQLLLGDRLNVLHWTEDGVTERAVVEGREVQAVEDHLLSCLFHFLHLAQDDAPLEIQGVLVQGGVMQDIRQDVDALQQVVLEALGVVHGLLPRGVRVQMAAHVLDLLLELDAAAPTGALEGHVLQEMRRAVVFLRFEAAARIDPNADRQRLVCGALGRHAQTARKGRDLCGRLSQGRGLGIEGARRFIALGQAQPTSGAT